MPTKSSLPDFRPILNRYSEWLNEGDRLGIIAEAFQEFANEVDEYTEFSLEDLYDLPSPLDNAIYGFVFCEVATYEYEETGFITDEFLKEAGSDLKPQEVEFLQALKKSNVSIFEIVEVVPGSHLMVKDVLLRSAPIKVAEKLASRSLVQWSYLATRLITVGDSNIFVGEVLEIPQLSALELKETFETGVGEAVKELPKYLRKHIPAIEKIRRDCVEGLSYPILAMWLRPFLTAKDLLPMLQNTDGEFFLWTTLRYEIQCDEGEIVKVLDSKKEFDRDFDEDALEWDWNGGEEGDILSSTIYIENGDLVAEVNSTERADRLDARLLQLLGKRVVAKPRKEHDFLDEGPPPEGAAQPLGADMLDHPEVQKAFSEQLTKHYRKALNDKIPMLGNKTPIQLVKTVAGREQVVEWLKLMENSSKKATDLPVITNYDFGWIWEELGIADLRK